MWVQPAELSRVTLYVFGHSSGGGRTGKMFREYFQRAPTPCRVGYKYALLPGAVEISQEYQHLKRENSDRACNADPDHV